jgi:hypothetical protein
MKDDPIVSEIHRVRGQIMAEFNNDLTAYVAYLRSRENELRSRGFRYSSIPRVEPIEYKPDAA